MGRTAAFIWVVFCANGLNGSVVPVTTSQPATRPATSHLAPFANVEPEESDIPLSRCQELVAECARKLGAPAPGKLLRERLQFDRLHLRRSRMLTFKDATAEVNVVTGQVAFLMVMDRHVPATSSMPAESKPLSAEQAILRAMKVSSLLDLGMTAEKVTTRWDGPTETANNPGHSNWHVFQPDGYKGLECYDSVTLISISAKDGSFQSFIRGYDPAKAAEQYLAASQKIEQEEALARVRATDPSLAQTDLTMKLRIVNPLMHRLAGLSEPFVAWVAEQREPDMRRPRRAWFVDAVTGIVHGPIDYGRP